MSVREDKFWAKVGNFGADYGGPKKVLKEELPVVTCEVCGEPATNFVRDIFREGTIEGFWRQSPGPIHGYCSEHATAGDVIDISSALHPRSINDV